jgi:hypothetical protein
MIIAADEVARSLAGAWDLLQRRAQGLRRFDASAKGVRRSFFAFLLLAPVFVTVLAAERASYGLLVQGAGLFDDVDLTTIVVFRMLIAGLTLPLVAYGFVRVLALRERFARFLVAANWSNVLSGIFLAVPATLYALNLATYELALLYSFAFYAMVAHLRWFVLRTALGVSGGIAALAVGCDLVCELLLTQLV